MKTSTKLIAGFFVLLFSSFVLYNYLLRQEYVKGNIHPKNYGSGELFTAVALPEFKHLVINGAVLTENGEVSGFMPNIRIKGQTGDSNQARVNRKILSMFKTRLVSDTLFISLVRESINPTVRAFYHLYESDAIVIALNSARSIYAKNAVYKVDSLPAADSLNLHFSLENNPDSQGGYINRSVELRHLKNIHYLKLDADFSQVKVYDSKINNLEYSLFNKAGLHLSRRSDVGTLIARHIGKDYIEWKNFAQGIRLDQNRVIKRDTSLSIEYRDPEKARLLR